MSDKTWGTKATQDVHQRADELVRSSGLDKKEWFEWAVSLLELKNLEDQKQYSTEIGEIERYTKRIIQMLLNMVQRFEFQSEEIQNKYEEQVHTQEINIQNMKVEINQYKDQLKQMEEDLDNVRKENEALNSQLATANKAHERSEELIDEYKEKLENLASLLAQHQGAAEENQKLKNDISTIVQEKIQLEHELSQRTVQLEELKQQHSEKVSEIMERSAFEQEKTLLAKEREYQGILNKVHEDYNIKIKEYQEQLNTAREESTQKTASHQDLGVVPASGD
ncbi:hypothetical protein [Shimazuella alba]|uniref:Uncharacterized protein n=1 Tax=Shimazuella alba TaxID=2690964 RepID=A0A6I4VZB3_9BACL|nr:hypothetical protein [Shimazuella alba]MXQ55290.1 hypothetical protein [Shimazuella alba]